MYIYIENLSMFELFSAGSVSFIVFSAVLLALLLLSKFFPKTTDSQNFPPWLKTRIETVDRIAVNNYEITYVLTIMFLLFSWLITFSWFYDWLSSGIIVTTQEIVFEVTVVISLGISSYFIAFIFSKHFNIKILQRSKTNRKKYLPIVLRFFIEWSQQLYSFGGLAYSLLMFWVMFLIPENAPLRPYWNITLPITFVWISIATLSLVVGGMLTLRVANNKVLIWLLNYLNDVKKDPHNYDYRFMLSEVIDYGNRFIFKDFPNVEELDLGKKFELLYLTKVWGNDSEINAASCIIQMLISKVKEKRSREFVEVLCTLDSNKTLEPLTKLKYSVGMVFTKKRKSGNYRYVLKGLSVLSTLIVIVTFILDHVL